MKDQIWQKILLVRLQSPLVQSITNYVVMNNTANALLAAGASPIMAHAHPEMQDMVSIVGALVINIGTLDEYWVQSMHLAINQANTLQKPWVLDPVGAGATPYRNAVLKELLSLRPNIIRGNASEIMSLAQKSVAATKGVDSTQQSTDAIFAAKALNQQFGSVVCISGADDFLVDKNSIVKISNGHPMMSRVTGLGCTATALTGAFAAVCPDDFLLAATAAMALLGVCGQLAAARSAGPGSLQLNLLDLLYTLTEEQFMEMIQVEENLLHD
ncbi:MAG: hydroxyethylthiazole kinase [Janthinobacterium lividum]